MELGQATTHEAEVACHVASVTPGADAYSEELLGIELKRFRSVPHQLERLQHKCSWSSLEAAEVAC